eukprot:4269084-Prorocentrum_lima.AAC.1
MPAPMAFPSDVPQSQLLKQFRMASLILEQKSVDSGGSKVIIEPEPVAAWPTPMRSWGTCLRII